MTSEREQAAWMFELLAVLHLHALAQAGNEEALSPRLERTLAALERMPAECWDKLLKFAELQRVRLRTLQLLERWVTAGALHLKLGRLDEMLHAAESENQHALSALDNVVSALATTGHVPIVIKTLDHWPDLGSDLDLFISASQQETVSILREQLHAEVQPRSWGDRLAHKWNFRIPGLAQLVEIHIGCLGQTGEHLRRSQEVSERS